MTQAHEAPQYIVVGEGDAAREIAILSRSAQASDHRPALVLLGGYRSDMSGTKAVELDRFAQQEGIVAPLA